MLNTISRSEASEKGLKRYFTGEPCRNGHVCERRTNSMHCLECVVAAKTNFRAKFDDDGWAERTKQWDDRYRDADPARKLAHSVAASQRLRERDPDYYRRKAIEWREKNPGVTAERMRLYHETMRRDFPDLVKISRAASNAKRRVINGTFRGYEIKQAIGTAWDRCGGKCELCGSTDRLELDHIIPVSRGGDNSDGNFQFLCLTHNRSKKASDYMEWLDRITLPKEMAA